MRCFRIDGDKCNGFGCNEFDVCIVVGVIVRIVDEHLPDGNWMESGEKQFLVNFRKRDFFLVGDFDVDRTRNPKLL